MRGLGKRKKIQTLDDIKKQYYPEYRYAVIDVKEAIAENSIITGQPLKIINLNEA